MPKTKQNNSDIDIGLDILTRHALPEQTLTLEDIAEVCSCHRNTIWKIEKMAIKKFKLLAERRFGAEFLLG